MEIKLTFTGRRWTVKNAEDFMEWLERELVYRDAELDSFITNGSKDHMVMKRLFRKKSFKK